MKDKERLDNIKSFLNDIIADAFAKDLEEHDGVTIAQELKKSHGEEEQPQLEATIYESIEDYTQRTGKRFRMTKDQRLRNLSREDAFNEFTKEDTNE
jgi:hypothetical protein